MSKTNVNDILVSVIMPVYNSSAFIKDAIESILIQTHKKIEFIIIDDGSVDGSELIIKKYTDDERIVFISRENKGLVYTLNQALKMANGEYIARMDSDDISAANRIEEQLQFLIKNPDIAVVGCASYIINERSDIESHRVPPSSPFLNHALHFFGPTLTHPSVCFNKKVIGEELYYSDCYPRAEDFELWVRLSRKYSMANIPKMLFYYRLNSNGISLSNVEEQKKNAALAYYKLKYPNVNDEKLLTSLQSIHSRDFKDKKDVIKSFLYIMTKYEFNKFIFIRFGYFLRWLLK
ncbi:TPA: glycosyltransferase [Kluyvera georgiana]|nr:glycosyltransferase [Kluyvera georgiana]